MKRVLEQENESRTITFEETLSSERMVQAEIRAHATRKRGTLVYGISVPLPDYVNWNGAVYSWSWVDTAYGGQIALFDSTTSTSSSLTVLASTVTFDAYLAPMRRVAMNLPFLRFFEYKPFSRRALFSANQVAEDIRKVYDTLNVADEHLKLICDEMVTVADTASSSGFVQHTQVMEPVFSQVRELMDDYNSLRGGEMPPNI